MKDDIPSNKLVSMMFIKLNVVSNEGLGSNTLQMLVIQFFPVYLQSQL